MESKRGFGTETTMLLGAILFACLFSCGDIQVDQEQTEEPLRFIEFFVFPTAPYVDKSYAEKVPEDELAFRQIDFDAEKKAIQEIYSAFIKAYGEENMRELRETLDITGGMEYGTTTGIVYGWDDIKNYIQANWGHTDCLTDLSWQLTDFYIRPKNVKAPWVEASAKGMMLYYDPGIFLCFSKIGRFYFTKRRGKWRIHQIDGSKYFFDDKYKTP